MYRRNLIDQEAWLREKSLESLKSNDFLELNDIVQVSENGNFYIVTDEKTDIEIKKGYYAKVIPLQIVGDLAGNSTTTDKLKTPINFLFKGDIKGEIKNFDGSESVETIIEVLNDSHNHTDDTIESLDASKINSGILSLERLPKEALDNIIVVENDEERFKLTKDQVQNRDYVKVKSPDNIVYKIIDDTKLNLEEGYIPYTFEVRWKKVLDKPTEFKPEHHTHLKNDITDFPESLKNPYNLEIKLNGISFTVYDGSSEKIINITPNSIGTYNYSEIDNKLDTKANVHHSHGNDEILNIDASKITSGIIDIERLPATALERLVEVQNDTERFNLTKDQIQLGDTVKVKETLKMYKVINDNKLNSEEGYTVYVAGRAAEVPWSGVTGKPSSFPPSSHKHLKNDISDFPESLKNPMSITIQLNGVSQGAYDGSSSKVINITPNSIGTYTVQEITDKLNQKSDTTHLHDDRYNTKVEVTDLLKQKSDISHNHDSTYSNINHNHNGVYSDVNHNHDSAYSNINHNHDSAYSNINHNHDSDYAKAVHSHDYLSINGGTIRGNLDVTGNITGSRVYNAVWNDYAEFFERGEETEPGDIISLDINSDKERYVKASKENPIVVGVHSDSFAHLIGGEEPQNGEDFFDYNINKFIPVGLAGRVKVKVIGQVKKGDSIVISHDIPGVGISSDKNNYNSAIVGTALENKTSEDIGLVKILIKK